MDPGEADDKGSGRPVDEGPAPTGRTAEGRLRTVRGVAAAAPRRTEQGQEDEQEKGPIGRCPQHAGKLPARRSPPPTVTLGNRGASLKPTTTSTTLSVRLVSVLLAAATLLVGCGESDDETVEPAPTSTVPFPTALPTPRDLTEGESQRAAPRWEQIRVVTGNAPAEIGPFTIAPEVIQWRVKWDCETGRMLITTTPPPTRPGPLVDSPCPESGEGFSRVRGEVRLAVQASGPWKATVEQQVDTPLDEPPLAEMAGARVLGRGEFYNVDKTGKGTAILYQLADGRRALRFEPGFEVFNDPDLVVWLSEAPSPKTSAEVDASPHAEIAALKSTKGAQNYIVPENLPIQRIGSVALYCVPVPSIYIAAGLS